jgi:hypothetical protein
MGVPVTATMEQTEPGHNSSLRSGAKTFLGPRLAGEAMMNGVHGNLVVRGVVAIAVVLIVAPIFSVANVFDSCCVKCRKVRPRCCCPTYCPAPAAVPQVTMQPQYRPQTVVSHRQVTETQYRTETFTEQVPVTTVENVTVDEGGYQQVWVPKVVTKQVARTVVQNRVGSRTVPVQVTRTVPEYRTTMVPVGSVVTNSYSTNSYVTGAYPTAVPGVGSVMGSPDAIQGAIPVATPISATPVSQPTVNPTPADRLVPMPTDAGQATPILPRSGSSTNGLTPIQPRSAKSGLFQAPPSAAMVWRSQMGSTTK